MDNNQDLNFLNQNNNQELFKQIDQEIKEKEKLENPNTTNDEFIKSLPDWDLPPLYEKVRRVNRQ
jgi:hypothetical protein